MSKYLGSLDHVPERQGLGEISLAERMTPFTGVIFATTLSNAFPSFGIAFRPHDRPRIAEGLPASLDPILLRIEESRFERVNIESFVMKDCR